MKQRAFLDTPCLEGPQSQPRVHHHVSQKQERLVSIIIQIRQTLNGTRYGDKKTNIYNTTNDIARFRRRRSPSQIHHPLALFATPYLRRTFHAISQARPGKLSTEEGYGIKWTPSLYKANNIRGVTQGTGNQFRKMSIPRPQSRHTDLTSRPCITPPSPPTPIHGRFHHQPRAPLAAQHRTINRLSNLRDSPTLGSKHDTTAQPMALLPSHRNPPLLPRIPCPNGDSSASRGSCRFR